MEVKELRINNLIYNDFGEIAHIYGVDEKSILTKVKENGWGICFKPKPIPLTEEWFLKFGFTRHWEDFYNDVIYIKKVTDDYTEFEWGVYPNELGSGIQIKNSIKLKYVHQLQNLYFALTGEELILKTQ